MLNKLKPHIGIFGRTNVGKSTFINTIAAQEIAIVSEHAGTTTDPVKKNIEMGELGPVILIDTAGTKDESELGQKRMARTLKVIKEVNIAVLLISHNLFDDEEKKLIEEFKISSVPFVIVHHQSDLLQLDSKLKERIENDFNCTVLEFSKMAENANDIIAEMARLLPEDFKHEPTLLGDLVSYGDIVVLVTPIDIEAPKGRLIMPQVQTIRDALDNECIVIVVKERELDLLFRKHQLSPKLVVTDSQAFLKVSALVPSHIPMTSFSILQARLKGHFDEMIEGTRAIEKLKPNDHILIMESCSHHIGGEDIGRVKIPRWLEKYKGSKLHFEFASGLDSVQSPPNSYALVIQCGGCMLSQKQVNNRLAPFVSAGVPITNYGMVISYSLGIYQRALRPFNKEISGDCYL